MRHVFLILIGVIGGYGAYSVFLFAYRWLEEKRIRRMVKKLRGQRAQTVTITPAIAPFATGGPLPPNCPTGRSPAFIAGWLASHPLSDTTKSEPLEETWSPEKIEAWRVISVTVEKGDDGMWLGFPHPDGPTEDIVIPIRHPIGIELHAECAEPGHELSWNRCDDSPGENCESETGSGCGFYAFKTQEQAIKYLETGLAFHTNWKRAVAHVLLSGKVIEHENGYRAEILEVVSIEFESALCCDPLLSVIGTATRAFNAFSNIVSGGV